MSFFVLFFYRGLRKQRSHYLSNVKFQNKFVYDNNLAQFILKTKKIQTEI